MPDLNTQLREYFDATAPPLEVEEVVGDEVLVPGGRKTRSRRWTAPGWAYGLATMVVVLVLILGLALLLPGGNNDVVEPTPTTVVPEPETMSDFEVIEAGVAALYSGDAERAVELFGIEDSPVWRWQGGGDDEAQIRDDDLIRQEAAYQAAIGGRLTLNCTELVNTPGMFTCNVPYHNALTDAVGYIDSPGDQIDVVVQEGVITQFALPNALVQGFAHTFPEHNFLLRTVVSFLREEVEGSEGCWDFPTDFLPTVIRTPDCANLIMDNLDDWAAWYEVNEPTPTTLVNEPTPTTLVNEPTPTTVLTTVPTPTTVLTTAPEVEATSSEISIALAFFDARNAYDVEAATALFNPDAHIYGGDFITGVDMYPALFDWLRATGWQWMVGECSMKSGDANTECAYHVENAWSRAIGIPPVPGVIAFEIWEGGMRWVPDFEVDQTDFSIMGRASEHPQFKNGELVEVWGTVTDWIRENHPTDVEAMISPDGSAPIFDARSIDLWRMYTQEFVEAVG